MRQPHYYFLAILLTAFGCQGPGKTLPPSPPKNDTSEVLRLAIDSGFHRYVLQEITRSRGYRPFGDSNLFLYNKTFAPYLPSVINGHKFKFLTQDQLCSVATRLRPDIYLPDYNYLISFKKTDSGYEVYMGSTCTIPNFDSNGRPLRPASFRKVPRLDTLKCIYGMLCGGGFDMTFKKEKDTIRGSFTGAWSD